MGYKDPDKNRFLAVLEGEIPDRVPNFEVFIEPHACSYILGRETKSATLASAVETMPAQDYIEICRRIGQDFIGLNGYSFPYWFTDPETGQPAPVDDGRIKDMSELKGLIGPDEAFDIHFNTLLRPHMEAYAEAVKGTDMGLLVITGWFFQTVYQFLLGFENFMLKLYDDLPLIEHLLDVSAAYNRRIVAWACEYPIDVLYIGDDLGFKSGLMIRPEMLKPLWLPRMRHIIEPARQKGIPIIFHSDGTIYDIMDELIELDFKALNPIEPYGMDIYKVKERWGDRIALMGNMDIAGPLRFGTPEEVVADTREHLERLMPGGRYIAASSHSITSSLPPENFMAMVETVHKYGRY